MSPLVIILAIAGAQILWVSLPRVQDGNSYVERLAYGLIALGGLGALTSFLYRPQATVTECFLAGGLGLWLALGGRLAV